jgi:hypothetical protein
MDGFVQVGRRQGGMKRRVAGISERDAMKLPRRTFLHLAAGAAALPVLSCIARAQTYPTRPVRIIIGFAPGGVVEIVARLIGQSALIAALTLATLIAVPTFAQPANAAPMSPASSSFGSNGY